MNLTIQIDDRDLDNLKRSLRISNKFYDLIKSGVSEDSEAMIFAERILRARRVLQLSNDEFECTI